MDPVRFREIRDQLNSDTKTKHYMVKSGDSWAWGDIESSIIPGKDEDLGGIECHTVNPDGFKNGNLVGFVYINQNCPGILFYGERSEEEKRALMYLWKVNHSDYREENS